MKPRSHPAGPRPDGYVRFQIGRGLAIVSSPTFILVDPLNGTFAERLWDLVEACAGVDALLEELSAVGLRSLGDFAMCQFEEDELRVVVRGRAQALVVSGDETISLAAGSVKTWVEAVFDDASSFALGIGELADSDLAYRIDRGIVPADQLHWGEFSVADPQLRELALGWVDTFEPVSVGRDQPRPHPVENALSSRPPAEVERSTARDHLPPGQTHDDTAGDDYDFDALYGRTVAKTVQGAAVGAAEEEAPLPSASAEVPNASVVIPSSDVPEMNPRPAPTESTESRQGLIDTVPEVVRSASDVTVTMPSDSEADRLGDHDGMTISMDRLTEIRQDSESKHREPTESHSSSPSIQALVCPDGHPNPPHGDTCMRCSSVLDGPPRVVPRPSLGRLVFSTGVVIDLDRPAIIGRNPRVEGSMSKEIPQLVQFSDHNLISRSHAMIHLESWHVLVEDLGSSNGTMVSRPGREPRLLMAREPVILEPGTVIILADEVSATFYGMEQEIREMM